MRRVLFIFLLVCGTWPATAQVTLPEMGSSSRATLSEAEERKLGEAFMREVRAHLEIEDDAEVEDYVQSLGYALSAHSDTPNQRFTFFVVKDTRINAFAAPGGYIGVNSGLILAAESESELAAVMAHEIAHVSQGHIARAIDMAGRSNLPAMAGMVAAIILGTQNPQMGQAAMAAVTAGRIQLQLDFTRSNEQEADRLGIRVLSDAGFDPRAMPTFFERLQQSYRYYREPPEFLSTHPVSSSRISDTRGRAESYPYRQYVDSIGYQLARAKLQVWAEKKPEDAVAIFRQQLGQSSGQSRQIARYGLALALARAGDSAGARSHLEALTKASPERLQFVTALASLELESGALEQALTRYRTSLRLFPDNKPLLRGYIAALLKDHKPEPALGLLERYARRRPLTAPLYKLKAETHDQLGQVLQAHLALAEHHYLNGRLEAAIQQLRIATRERTDDFFLNSRVEARLDYYREERAQRAAK